MTAISDGNLSTIKAFICQYDFRNALNRKLKKLHNDLPVD